MVFYQGTYSKDNSKNDRDIRKEREKEFISSLIRQPDLLLIPGSRSCFSRVLGVSNLYPGVFSTPSRVVEDR